MSEVALCIYGQPRFFDAAGYRSIKRLILDVYQPDVYFHTWWSEQDVGKSYSAAPWSGVQGSSDLTVRSGTVERLKEIYRPVKYESEPIRVFKPARDYSANTSDKVYSAPNLLSSTYSMMRALGLIPPSARYRWVIRCRFDSLFGDFPDLSRLDNSLFYIPDICPNPDLFYDCVSIGNLKDSLVVADLYSNLDRFFLAGVEMNAEQMFFIQLAINNMLRRTVKYKTNYGHCRSWDAE